MNAYLLVLLLAGLFCLLRKYRILLYGNLHVMPSNGSWTDFGLFIWALVSAVCFTSAIIKVPKSLAENIGLSLTVLHSIALNCLLGVILSLFFKMGTFFKGFLWVTKRFSAAKLLKRVGLYFLMLFPVLGLVNVFWVGFLEFFHSLGWIQELQAQAAIEAFKNSSGWVETSILSLNALFIAPVLEEVIFRGGVYRFLKQKMRVRWAALISSGVFALLHGNLLAFFPLWILGLFFTRLYEETGFIVAPIALHGIFNGHTLFLLMQDLAL